MKNMILIARAVFLGFCIISFSSFNKAASLCAQVSLTNYNTYLQNFNSLTTSATQSAFLNNSTLQGWYLQHESYNVAYFGISANDGTNITRNFYSLGSNGSSDRALGGMATDVNTGSGYIGFRVKNTTSETIRNFEITHTMEQWYNSGNEARFDFSYTTKAPGTAITSLLEHTATWVHIDELDAVTPSTTSPIGTKTGNMDAHRVVKRFTIKEINLLPNQEIMLRWQYITINATNGNGLALDDVAVTPQINVFYALNTGDFENKATWARNKNGSGGGPTDFSLPNQVFHITTGGGRPLKGSMNMTGNNSKIVLGDGINPIDVKINPSSTFLGKVDVSNNATLNIENTTSPVLGNLAENSTIIYSHSNQNLIQYVAAPVYGNLKFTGKSRKVLANDILVNGDLTLDNSHVEIGNYNLALHKTKTIQGGSKDGYIKTNGTGKVSLSVPRTDTDIIFPIGNSTYNPIVLKQHASGSEDEFMVKVIDGIFTAYDQNDIPTGEAIIQKAINRTWLVAETTSGGSNLTMKLFWNEDSELPDFHNQTAFISHYENNHWDEIPFENPETIDGFHYVTRSNIQTFSPYGILSDESVLPVSLLDFTAMNKGEWVLIEWKTSSENNNDRFTLESSSDAINFMSIVNMKGAGNSQKIKNYDYVDNRMLNNERYYRLKQTDFDGKVNYSPIISVKAVSNSLILYPTQSKNIINIRGRFENLEDFEIMILDIYGKTHVIQSHISKSLNHITFDIASLPSNSYLLKIKSNNKTSILKFIKI